jgi:hypothetical protein
MLDFFICLCPFRFIILHTLCQNSTTSQPIDLIDFSQICQKLTQPKLGNYSPFGYPLWGKIPHVQTCLSMSSNVHFTKYLHKRLMIARVMPKLKYFNFLFGTDFACRCCQFFDVPKTLKFFISKEKHGGMHGPIEPDRPAERTPVLPKGKF